MKKLATAFAVLLATAGVAMATDLPNKKAAPAAPKAALCDSVKVEYGQNFADGDLLGDKTSDAYGLSYSKCLGAFTVGGAYSSTNNSDGYKQNLEVQGGYKVGVGGGFILGTKVGVGQRFLDGISTNNSFPYYAVYGTADYRLNDAWTINALEYRYRNAFDVGNDYQSHRLGTGVTYNINETYSVNAKAFRDYDSSFGGTSDGVLIGFTVRF